jgi:hypothetical protein
MKATARILIPLTLIALIAAGCGRKSDEEQLLENGGKPVDGMMTARTQCIYGAPSEPRAARMELWSCPLAVERLQLTEPPKTLAFSVDCKKKLLTIRNLERGSLDTLWEILPDGSFSVSMPGGPITLGNDGKGSACATTTELEVTGKVNCQDRDKAEILFETVWRMGPQPNSTVTTELPAGARQCELPTGCYLYSSAKLNQCQ